MIIFFFIATHFVFQASKSEKNAIETPQKNSHHGDKKDESELDDQEPVRKQKKVRPLVVQGLIS